MNDRTIIFPLVLLFVFFYFEFSNYFVYPTSGENCVSHTLSISSIDQCRSGDCRLVSLGHVRLSATKGSSLCARVQEIGGMEKLVPFTFTIYDSFIHYPVSYCYYTDDPQPNFEGYCRCPPRHTVDCRNCPITNKANNHSICVEGLSSAHSCILAPFGSVATYCGQLWFTGTQRYKICRLGSPKLVIELKYFDGQDNHRQSIDLSDTTVIDNDHVKFTIFKPELGNFHNDKFLLTDMFSNTNLFIVPSSEINSVNGKDVTKLGWYKSDISTTYEGVRPYFHTQGITCTEDTFASDLRLPTIANTLIIHPEWNANIEAMGSVFIDPSMPTIQYPNTNPASSVSFIGEDGAYFYDMSGELYVLGLTADNQLPYKVEVVLTNWQFKGVYDGSAKAEDISCTPFFASGIHNGTIYYVATCLQHGSYANWGICSYTQMYNLTRTIYTCVDADFYAETFPDHNFCETLFDAQPNVNNSFVYSNCEGPVINTNSSQFFMPPVGIEIELSFELKTLKIQFESTDTIPKIDSIDTIKNKTFLSIGILSTTKKGDCAVYSENNLFSPTNIEIHPDIEWFEFGFVVRKFDSSDVITVNCHGRTAMLRYKLSMDHGDGFVDYSSIKSAQIMEDSVMDSDKHWWEKIPSFFAGLPFIPTGWKSLFARVMWYIVWIIIGIISLILLYYILVFFFLWVFPWLYRWIRAWMAHKREMRKQSQEAVDQGRVLSPSTFFSNKKIQ